jgi:hypothetical protein
MSILTNALELGYPVFPVRLCSDVCLKCDVCKTPATPHGFKDASSDPEQVRQLWKLYPGQAIGVPTGETSGFDVLDVDSVKHPEAANWWLSHRRYIPHTRVHQTGSGGLHVLFKHSDLARTGNGRLGTGIDVKANGGYVVWWPTHRKVLMDAPIAMWPKWLITKQQPAPVRQMPFKPRGTSTDLLPVAKFVASLPEGQRNRGSFWGFCRAYEAVASGAVGEAEAIDIIGSAAMQTGLSLVEVRKVARSALRKVGGR